MKRLIKKPYGTIEQLSKKILIYSSYKYDFDPKTGNGVYPMDNTVKNEHLIDNKIYRAVDSNEYEFIIKGGYIKSNSSRNFDSQYNMTFFGKTINEVFGYYRDCKAKTGEAYIIEVDIKDIDLYMNHLHEIYTFKKIPKSYILGIYKLDDSSKVKKIM